jgi:peptide chain release factor 2
MRDFTDDLNALRKRLDEARGYLRIDELRRQRPQIETEASRPDLWDDADNARKVTGELSQIIEDIELFESLETGIEDAETLAELAREEGDESFEAEITESIAELGRRFGTLELRALFTGEWDEHDAVCSINSGAGGADAQDWAEMMLRMYKRWAERHSFGFELEEVTAGSEAGISSATFLVKGLHAYGMLRSEKGTHRLVRIGPFNAQGKRQTAFAAFSVIPLIEDDETEIVIDDKDLRVDLYRSSGAGGQHVNVTDSAVRLTHLPTGIVVSCQNERSQHQNKDRAMKVLKAKLADLERQKRADELDAIAGAKTDIDFGTQIRSYVIHPYQMVKDLRSGYESGRPDAVLDGDLDGFMEAYLQWERSGASAAGDADDV